MNLHPLITALAASTGAGDAHPMIEKIRFLLPEGVLFTATVLVMVLGLSRTRRTRDLCAWVSAVALMIAGVLALATPVPQNALLPGLMPFFKAMVAVVGLMLVMLFGGSVDRDYELSVSRGVPFDPLRSNRGEFFAFFLFSLTGLMLCASADDLIWLFLALELTSLPTYVMVSTSTPRARSQEAGVKYFFLGAFGAATFLFGFAFLYGATGTTTLFGSAADPGIAQILAAQGAGEGLSTLAILGFTLALAGIAFKIAAVPMHFYTPDVYEGASTPMAAYLAFVPKAAGFIAMMLLLSTVGWGYENGLPEPIRVVLWVMAALTMTVGNVLAILQKSLKRILAYSSIAHSGYMLVGLIAGPGTDGSGFMGVPSNGLGAVLLYLLVYGVTNIGAFAVICSLERDARGTPTEEISTVDDLRGLCATHRLMGWTMVLCIGSLLGLPPLLGFFAKVYLFTSVISAGEYALAIVLGLNSAIAAFYYIGLMRAPLLEQPDDRAAPLRTGPYFGRIVAGLLSAASTIVLLLAFGGLMTSSDAAGRYVPPVGSTGTAGAGGTSSAPAPVEGVESRPETSIAAPAIAAG